MTCDGCVAGRRSSGGAARARQITYSATTVLPLLVGALTSTPRRLSRLCSASTWKSSRRKGRVASKAATRSSTGGAARRLIRGSQVEELEARLGDQRLPLVLDVAQHLLTDLVGVAAVTADAGDPQGGQLPGVLVVDLGDGDVEGAPHPLDHRADHLALLLQGVALGDVQRDHEGTDDHRGHATRERPSAPGPRSRPGRGEAGYPPAGGQAGVAGCAEERTMVATLGMDGQKA